MDMRLQKMAWVIHSKAVFLSTRGSMVRNAMIGRSHIGQWVAMARICHVIYQSLLIHLWYVCIFNESINAYLPHGCQP